MISFLVLDASNDLFTVQEKRWNGTLDTYTKRVTALPIFAQMCHWLSAVGKEDWESSFTLRFQLQQYYLEIETVFSVYGLHDVGAEEGVQALNPCIPRRDGALLLYGARRWKRRLGKFFYTAFPIAAVLS